MSEHRKHSGNALELICPVLIAFIYDKRFAFLRVPLCPLWSKVLVLFLVTMMVSLHQQIEVSR